MGLQKYRADTSEPQDDGAVLHYAKWVWGPTLSKITNCRIENFPDKPRGTVYITGEADTFFSIPAAMRYKDKTVRGFVTSEDGMTYFHAYGSK